MGVTLPSPNEVVVAPLAIGPANAEQLTGQSWRWWRDHASDLGLQVVRVAGKPMIDAAAVVRVLAQQAAEQRVERELTVDQHTDQLLKELGYVPTARGAVP